MRERKEIIDNSGCKKIGEIIVSYNTSVQDKFIRGTPGGKNRKAAAFVLSEKVLQTI